ncbi:hypothetical protein Poli38472_012022 [Pythium oligandrum]|uniref:Purple acid phosphatase n=1 Tax=Pythium oligandrum TaxID=41045 RepID=A0A8K1CNJ0_PYTOL|nr:hypothetical protein Poli38472_012022 [Pythium oligandrum]|eukprot:TMW66906.1 hypothetical protein Poli38472_012022 [Pythium oligandrum]
MMFLLQTLCLATLVASVTPAIVVDDKVCVYKTASATCTPRAICASQPKAGDKTPADSCRVLPHVLKLPQQVHLAYAGATAGTGMSVSWATYENVDSSIWLGSTTDGLVKRADIKVSSSTYFSDDGYSLYQHHATVLGLQPHTKYFYKVGSSSNDSLVSEVAAFTTARPANNTEEFDVAIYGDLGFGTKGEASTDFINALASNLSFVYHVGDIGYADDDFLVPSQALGFYYEKVYNKWMNSMTPLMQQVPYMVTVGNHEAECHSPACLVSDYKKDHLGNYSAYNARFRMPSNESKGVKSMWYAFEYGPLHITSISSETDYKDSPGNAYTVTHKNGGFGNQLAWLEEDLKNASANRANVPWLIVGMHRPIYHRKDTDRSGKPTGDSLALQKAFEELFIKYGVDLVIAGHEHGYERHFPIVRGKAVKDGVSADNAVYANPKAPVYIVTGGPGNPEPNMKSGKSGVAWNVLESDAYAISTMQVTRQSLAIKHITTDTQTIVDEFTITKA